MWINTDPVRASSWTAPGPDCPDAETAFSHCPWTPHKQKAVRDSQKALLSTETGRSWSCRAAETSVSERSDWLMRPATACAAARLRAPLRAALRLSGSWWSGCCEARKATEQKHADLLLQHFSVNRIIRYFRDGLDGIFIGKEEILNCSASQFTKV